MASLMENLIAVLGEENAEYEKLLKLSMEKTPVIVGGDLEELQRITDEEQNVVTRINYLDTKREEVIRDIANVLNKDVKTLKLTNIINLLESRPKEQQQLAAVHDALKETVSRMGRVNDQNRELIQNSLEMVEFDLNLLQAMKSAPQTANYGRGAGNSAYSVGSVMGAEYNGFDAKQ